MPPAATLQTVNDMLKAQLREAAADRAAKAARISELERQVRTGSPGI